VLLGKTYGNWMVDLRATNIKLKARSIRIVSVLAELSEPEAIQALERCDGEVKVAIVSARRNLSATQSRELLRTAGGKLRVALALKQ
jgi:N-acetylmuramic acid 6-phosphate (MurNAc-6-P) etherase